MTSKWGPTYWSYIHMITLNYPNKPTKKERDKHFFMVRNFIDTLPCPTCRNEMNNIINDNNLRNSLGSKEKFMKYFWNIHNQVNKRLNKPQLSLKKFKKLYSSQTSFSVFKLIKSNKLKNIVIVILLLIISILGGLLLKK
jgi:hypothetical protein